jgi:hypothetical protein
MNSKDRIYSDKISEQDANKRDLVAKNLGEIEARTALREDYREPVEEKELTRMQRKMRRIFGAGKQSTAMFVQGFKMGGAVGCCFGGLLGAFYAFKMRSFSVLPVSMFGSAMSMGFFMGMGMMIRGSGF